MFGVKVVESFLAGTTYVRSKRDIQIVLIELSKWKAFWKCHDMTEFETQIIIIQHLSESLKEEDKLKCEERYEQVYNEIHNPMKQYDTSSQLCIGRSEVCKYWGGINNLSNMPEDR